MTSQPPLGDLLKELRDETTTLFREEVALAKKEMSEKVSQATRNVVYLIAGALIAYSALVLLLFACSSIIAHLFLERGMERTMADFFGYLIVGGVTGIIAGILISKALKTLKQQSFVPERTIYSLKADKQFAQNQIP